jgi:hypothetical protein
VVVLTGFVMCGRFDTNFLFCLYQCKDYCHRVTTRLQLVGNNNNNNNNGEEEEEEEEEEKEEEEEEDRISASLPTYSRVRRTAATGQSPRASHQLPTETAGRNLCAVSILAHKGHTHCQCLACIRWLSNTSQADGTEV